MGRLRSTILGLNFDMTPAHSTPPHRLTVAIVEDDSLLREEMAIHLRSQGMQVYAVNSASALDDLTARARIDVFVIDLNLPGEGGLSLCSRLRTSMPQAGIVICTGRSSLVDRIASYKQGGADAFLAKPVSPDELVLVLESLGRRLQSSTSIQSWLLSLRDRSLRAPDGQAPMALTEREKTLLVGLVQATNHTLASGVLCDIFGQHEDGQTISKHSLEELVARLRKKIKSAQPEGSAAAIKSVWGVGYQLCIPINLVH
jgi:DNA-binding response OmpR family regulator